MADIVVVVDISGSMVPCIDALRQNIETFVGRLNPFADAVGAVSGEYSC